MLFYSKTCTVEECAKLCLEQEGCEYFIVGNGKIDGVDKTGAWWRFNNLGGLIGRNKQIDFPCRAHLCFFFSLLFSSLLRCMLAHVASVVFDVEM